MAEYFGPNRNQTRFATTDDKDPERIVQCPYDDVHLVRASRMARHLIACRKNHPSSEFKACCFNAQHVVAVKEYELHINTCPDKRMIKQDAEKDAGAALVLPTPERNDHLIPDCDEDWDEDATAQTFTPSVSMGSYQPVQYNDPHNFDAEYYDEYETPDMQDNYEDTATVEIDIVPEKPDNWESLTQAQRKNHKRKYRRQQERLKEAGLEIVDSKKSKNPEDWTEEERDIKLKSICSQYAIPGRGGGTFTDYKSILNQYCQKNRMNIPTYRETTSQHQFGGFASECIVKTDIFRSHAYCQTKKEASHDAAKWALMAMELNDDNSGKPKTVCVAQTGTDLRVRREGDETRRLMGAGYIGPSVDKKIVRQANPTASQSNYQEPQPTESNNYDWDDEYEDNYTSQNNAPLPLTQSNQVPPVKAPAWGARNPAIKTAPAVSAPSTANKGGPWNKPQSSATSNNAWGAGRPAMPLSRPPPGFPALSNGASNDEALAKRFGRGVTISPNQPSASSPGPAQKNNDWQSVEPKKRGFGRGRGTTLAKANQQ